MSKSFFRYKLFLMALGALWMLISACGALPQLEDSPLFSLPTEPTALAIQETVPTDLPTTGRTCAIVLAESLNVRIEPDYHSPTMGWFYQGQFLDVRKQEDPDWWQVYGEVGDGAIVGYVRSSYLKVVSCSGTQ